MQNMMLNSVFYFIIRKMALVINFVLIVIAYFSVILWHKITRPKHRKWSLMSWCSLNLHHNLHSIKIFKIQTIWRSNEKQRTQSTFKYFASAKWIMHCWKTIKLSSFMLRVVKTWRTTKLNCRKLMMSTNSEFMFQLSLRKFEGSPYTNSTPI